MPSLHPPVLTTPRLVLRAFTLEDADRVEELAGHFEVARFTAQIPHPYPAGSAAKWIAGHTSLFLEQQAVIFAIQEKGGPLIGAIQLTIELAHRRAELGYWIGHPFWGRGYCTEAARGTVEHGFRDWDLHRIHSSHLGANPASGRVLEKLGMKREGLLREHTWRDETLDDLVLFGLLRSEWS